MTTTLKNVPFFTSSPQVPDKNLQKKIDGTKSKINIAKQRLEWDQCEFRKDKNTVTYRNVMSDLKSIAIHFKSLFSLSGNMEEKEKFADNAFSTYVEADQFTRDNRDILVESEYYHQMRNNRDNLATLINQYNKQIVENKVGF